MNTGSGGRRRERGRGSFGGDFDYRRWAQEGFHLGDDMGDTDGAEDTDNTDDDGVGRGRHVPGRQAPAEHEAPERRSRQMPDGDYDDPAFVDAPGSSDEPGRFDISDYAGGLYGGPASELIGDPSWPSPAPGRQARARHERDPQPPAQRRPSQSEISRSQPLEPHPSQPAPPRHAPRGEAVEHDSGSLVRPYARTGGRTRSDYDLALEALVSTSERGRSGGVAVLPEHRSICGLCTDARSVAEIAAHLRVPLGVARVLIGDMAGMGLVMVHESGMVVGDRPSMEFLERVLSGLRKL